MPSNDVVLGALRAHLVAAGVVRLPATAPAAAPGAHPLFLDPRKGAPSPDDKADLKPNEYDAAAMLSAFSATPLPTAGLYSRIPVFDIEIRCRAAQTAYQLERLLTQQLIQVAPQASLPKINWQLGSGGQVITVIESQIVRELQPLGVDRQSFIFIVSYGFEVYRD